MANIKFSQFTVGNTESDIDFVVGYKGANNIQISPSNLLSATLSGYLPLTGGTMSGSVIFSDGVYAYFGGASDLGIVHSGADSLIINETGDLYIRNKADDKDIIFQSDDGSGGTTTYFKLDGSSSNLQYFKDLLIADNVSLLIGNSSDLIITHNGSNSFIHNVFGNLTIKNSQNDGDISFQSDDGSGGVTEYFRLDGGSSRVLFSKNQWLTDNVKILLGNNDDLQIYHNATDSAIENNTGDLYISNFQDNGDIIFRSDNGSGGHTQYFRIDGGDEIVVASKEFRFLDNVSIKLGTGPDFQMLHNGSNTSFENSTGNLLITNNADDGDIVFKSDDGSGGVTTYFQLDGSANIMIGYKSLYMIDDKRLYLGTAGDLEIYHDGTDSRIYNNSGDFVIRNQQVDGDIKFQSDNGSGGTTTYFFLDGSRADGTYLYTEFPDNSIIGLGNDTDLQIYHNSTNSIIDNYTGDLAFQQKADDKDIVFKCDDGSGGVATYFQLDGGQSQTRVFKNFKFEDNVKATFGTSDDLQIYHDSFSSQIDNYVGNLLIKQRADDADISFQCDDGSGSLAEYFRLDGSSVQTIAEKDFRFIDNAKVILGTGSDLQISHDGSNSFIQDVGTGNLFIEAVSSIQFRKYNTAEFMARFINDAAVELYYDNVKKLETTNTGIKITGVSEYADNTAAIAGGLTTGDVYRTGDLLKIVH